MHFLAVFFTNFELTSWNQALLENPSIAQLFKNFPAYYGTQRSITVFTGVLHWSLSSATSIQSTKPHLICLRSSWMLATHLSLGLPSGLLPSGFPTNVFMHFYSPPLAVRIMILKSQDFPPGVKGLKIYLRLICVGVLDEERGFITNKAFVSSTIKLVLHAKGASYTWTDRYEAENCFHLDGSQNLRQL
jgi:hypothetical protein